MNLTAILAITAVVGTVAAGAGGYVAGRSDGRALEAGEHRQAEELLNNAQAVMIATAAEAIGKIEVRHVTIREQLEREIVEKPVYRDCRHDPSGLRLINDALTNGAEPAGAGRVPGVDPPAG